MAEQEQLGYTSKAFRLRDFMAVGITLFSIAAVTVLSITIVLKASDGQGAANSVLTATLPLLGSWVGTILAYYFSKDNFESANQSLSKMVDKITPPDKLQSIPVTQVMIPKEKIFSKKLSEAEQITLFDVLGELDKSNGIFTRLPILDDEKSFPCYVLHRSTIEKYLADKVRTTDASVGLDLKEFSIKDLLEDDAFKGLVIKDSAFVTVDKQSNLSDAKNKMDSLPRCDDVFVTETGKSDEPLVGWITDSIIMENASV